MTEQQLVRGLGDIPLSEIQTAIKSLNDSDLVDPKLKVIGTKENLLKAFIKAINDMEEGAEFPEPVVVFYNSLIEEKTEDDPGDPVREDDLVDSTAEAAGTTSEQTAAEKKAAKAKAAADKKAKVAADKKASRDDTKAKFIAKELSKEGAKINEVVKALVERFGMSVPSARSLTAKVNGVRKAVLEDTKNAYGAIYQGLKKGQESFTYCSAMISTVKRYKHLFE